MDLNVVTIYIEIFLLFIGFLLYFSVQISCGRKIAENLTYWESNEDVGSSAGDCNVEVCKIVDSITQIRLNFDSVSTIHRKVLIFLMKFF